MINITWLFIIGILGIVVANFGSVRAFWQHLGAGGTFLVALSAWGIVMLFAHTLELL